MKRDRASGSRGYPVQETMHDLPIGRVRGMPCGPATKTDFDIGKDGIPADKYRVGIVIPLIERSGSLLPSPIVRSNVRRRTPWPF